MWTVAFSCNGYVQGKVVYINPSVQPLSASLYSEGDTPLVVSFAYTKPTPEKAKASITHWLKALKPEIWSEYFTVEPVLGEIQELPSETSEPPSETYSSIALGGTFDGLHCGHLLMLARAAQLIDKKAPQVKLYLGLMPDFYIKKKVGGEMCYRYKTREFILKNCMIGFLLDLGYEFHADVPLTETRIENTSSITQYRRVVGDSQVVQIEISELDEMGLGVAIVAKDIECLVATPETVKGANMVNACRIERGLKAVVIDICPLVLRSDIKMSSSETRQKELDKFRVFEKLYCGRSSLRDEEEMVDVIRSLLVPYVDADTLNINVDLVKDQKIVQKLKALVDDR